MWRWRRKRGERKMPRIRRYFPVNHEINGDPEVWELTERFGDRALRVWLEILSITDRTEGVLRGQRDHIETSIRARCRMAKKTVSSILDYAIDKAWLVSDGVLRVRKYPEYHKSREHNKSQSEPKQAPSFLPTNPTNPKNLLSGKPDGSASRNGLDRDAEEVLSYFNAESGRSFMRSKTSLAPVRARLREGFTVDDCKAVVASQVKEWRDNPKMRKYLRPVTLFGPEKFEGYLQEARQGPPPGERVYDEVVKCAKCNDHHFKGEPCEA
jgi:uncharacterized phage protein (TIGR02220 family)